MRRFLFAFWIVLSLAAVVAGGFGALGYYSHKFQIEPVYGLAERLDRKARRILGLPTKTVDLVRSIDTIYLRLAGRSYLMPNNDFRNGGALTVWDDDILIMHQSGTVYYLDEPLGFIKTDFTPPDNGLEGYIELAAERYPERDSRAESVRYNDIEYIETVSMRGIVLSYTHIDVESECYRNRVSWLPLPDSITSIQTLKNGADDWETLFESTPCLSFNATRELIVPYMAGGRVAFKAPNLLYLGNGEYHLDGIYRPDAGIQSDTSDYGKTIEINLETRTSRHYSKGHRNLQGVAVDTEGRLWTTEHGMRGGDELNLIVDGENYGWPLENLGTLYSGAPAPSISGVGRHDVYQPPIFAWLPSAAVSSLAIVKGFHEAWDGDLLIGSLRGRTLFRARIQENRLVFLEEIPIGQRIRDVMKVAPDRIALWLDTNEIVVFEIEERHNPLDGIAAGLSADGMTSSSATQVASVLKGCNECHSFEENIHQAGPSLFNVLGRKIAGTAFPDYSPELRAYPGVWDSDTLAAYLVEPGAMINGTLMTGLGVENLALARNLVLGFKWLKAQSSSGGPGY